MLSRFVVFTLKTTPLILLYAFVWLVVTIPTTARLIGYRGPRQYGSYKVKKTAYEIPEVLDQSNPRVIVLHPRKILQKGNTEKFPLVIFAHGFFGGDWKLYPGHISLLRGVASFGFIVLAPQSCDTGCPSYGEWGTYYLEQLKLIRWAQTRTSDKILQHVDHDATYGIFGHSMGGQATIRSLVYADEYNISAAVVLHPVLPEEGIGNITTPLASFTGTDDGCCGAITARPVFDAAALPKAYANIVNGKHTEPNFFFPRWPAYIAAWFKIYLTNDKSYFYNLIFGKDLTSLCGGGIRMTNDCAAMPAVV